MTARHRAFVGLGSNLGDRPSYLRQAIAGLPDVVRVSPVYETDPVGGPLKQGRYLNMVVELLTDLDARALLGCCHQVEDEAQRVRLERNGPRTLDADVLWIDGGAVDEPDLQVPHVRMFQRPFVLAPLSHLAPDLAPPGWQDRFDHLGVELLGSLDELP